MTAAEALRRLHEAGRIRRSAMPGMLVRLSWADGPRRLHEDHAWLSRYDLLPDLTDPATVGCLLALLREATGDPLMYAHPPRQDLGWSIIRGSGWWASSAGHHPTEAEAIAAALVALAEAL